MSFILKICFIQQITFLSILGVCTQLTYLGALTKWRVSPNFIASLIMQRCHSGNLLRLTVCTWGYCVYIWPGPKWFHIISIFSSSQPFDYCNASIQFSTLNPTIFASCSLPNATYMLLLRFFLTLFFPSISNMAASYIFIYVHTQSPCSYNSILEAIPSSSKE